MKRLIYVAAGGGVGEGQDGQRGAETTLKLVRKYTACAMTCQCTKKLIAYLHTRNN